VKGLTTLLPIPMKWEYLDQCCACKWHGTYTLCKCKNKYIYMILHGYVKQCNNVKNMIFTQGGEIS
jgi:hypothetical protein